jgi:hypothetical protein
VSQMCSRQREASSVPSTVSCSGPLPSALVRLASCGAQRTEILEFQSQLGIAAAPPRPTASSAAAQPPPDADSQTSSDTPSSCGAAR